MKKPRLRHTNAITPCPLCEDKLKSAHPKIVSWFNEQVKPKFPTCHISDAWRGEKEQNAYVASGQSDKPWPKSKHNNMEDGKPMSLALDLFEIDSNGLGLWRSIYFKMIADASAHLGYIRWGGDWNGDGIRNEKLVDGPHFELKG